MTQKWHKDNYPNSYCIDLYYILCYFCAIFGFKRCILSHYFHRNHFSIFNLQSSIFNLNDSPHGV